jgi:acetoin utilization deacetylase AcuC-like enzyme
MLHVTTKGGLRCHNLIAGSQRRRCLRCNHIVSAALVTPSTRLLFAASPALDHDWPGHPESAARVPAILDELAARGLTPEALGPVLVQLTDVQEASDDALRLVHTQQYINSMRLLSDRRAPCLYDTDTYLQKTSWESARRGVGAALALVDAVVSASRERLAPSGFALCRPPGHHALQHSAMGFCIISTAAVAARHAQQVHGLRKVLIYDFDTHHGNGTQAAFENDPSVLYVSTHQHNSFPYTGALTEVGTGPGEGATANVPLPGGSGDAAARQAMESIVGPLAERFQPDIIIASAGYDAHWRDPLAGMMWRDSTYHSICTSLRALAEKHCSGRLVCLLEGGYDLKGLARGAADSFAALLGMPPGASDPDEKALRTADEPSAAVAKVITEARSIHGL